MTIIGLCHCGCGGRTPLASKTSKERGNVAGQPIKYLKNHHRSRKPVDNASTRERFFRFVQQGSPDECWEWRGNRNWQGYGRMSVASKNAAAHRVSFTLHHGQIPAGMVIRHTCDNPPCVNPSHLLAGTYRENSDDARSRGRLAKGEAVGTSRLSRDQVQAIRAAHAQGATKKGLARQYGVARYAIQQLLKGETWAWLPEESA